MPARGLIGIGIVAISLVASCSTARPPVAPVAAAPPPQASPSVPPGQDDPVARLGGRVPSPAPTTPPLLAGGISNGARVLARALEGLGGAAPVDQLRTLELHGRTTRMLGGRTTELEVITRVAFPRLYRQEIILPIGSVATLIGPDGAFIVTTQGAESTTLPLPEAQRREIESGIMRNPVVLMKTRRDPTFEVVAAAPAEIDGRKVEQAHVLSGGESTLISVDAESGRVVQASYGQRSGDKDVPVVVRYSDFRPIGGLVYPYESRGTVDGQPAFTTILQSVIVNASLDPSLFVPPVTPGTAAPASPSPAGRR